MTSRVWSAVVGVALIAAVLSTRSALLVRPWFVPVLVATGLVLLLAAVLARRTPSARWAAVLVMPIVAGAALAPSVVGRVSQGPVDTTVLQARLGDPTNPLLEGRGGGVDLLQISVAESKLGGVALAGRRISIDGIVTGPARISRAVMVCCAADARTISLRVTGEALPAKDTWIRVWGTLTTSGADLVLEARRVRPIRTPEQPFL